MNIPLSAIVIQPDQFRPQVINCFYNDDLIIHIRRDNSGYFYYIPTTTYHNSMEKWLLLDKHVTFKNKLKCLYYLGIDL